MQNVVVGYRCLRTASCNFESSTAWAVHDGNTRLMKLLSFSNGKSLELYWRNKTTMLAQKLRCAHTSYVAAEGHGQTCCDSYLYLRHTTGAWSQNTSLIGVRSRLDPRTPRTAACVQQTWRLSAEKTTVRDSG